jgi:hypothetical protein
METIGLKRKANELRDSATAIFVRPPPPRRPDIKRIAALWFIGGMAIASFLGFFFDNRRGAARRHMAYDKLVSTSKDVKGKGEKRVRHLRNKAIGTVKEMRSAAKDTNGEAVAAPGSATKLD